MEILARVRHFPRHICEDRFCSLPQHPPTNPKEGQQGKPIQRDGDIPNLGSRGGPGESHTATYGHHEQPGVLEILEEVVRPEAELLLQGGTLDQRDVARAVAPRHLVLVSLAAGQQGLDVVEEQGVGEGRRSPQCEYQLSPCVRP